MAGNPNSGKTTIFNNLTGARQKVGNYPGVTVEWKEGTVKRGDLSWTCRPAGHLQPDRLTPKRNWSPATSC